MRGRIQPPLISTREEDVSKLRHLCSMSKADVRMLQDMSPTIEYINLPAEPVLQGVRVSWHDFLRKFPLPPDSHPSAFRHSVPGGQFVWGVPGEPEPYAGSSADAQAMVASSSNRGGGPAPPSGPRLELHKATQPTCVDQLLRSIQEAAQSGNMALVKNRCGALQDMLKLLEPVTKRGVATAKSTEDPAGEALQRRQRPGPPGGWMYRPDFMLHAVLTSDFVQDPSDLSSVVKWSLASTASRVSFGSMSIYCVGS